tara:strand:- start:831 stop:1295 length:465 start_codon:yes stop_codon:yes gene_type:complete
VNGNVTKYLNQQVLSASPSKLVYMLYDRAISSLREAILAIEQGEVEKRWKANNRAMEIVQHMWATLNIDDSGEIGDNLNKLLPYMMFRLPDVDIHNDPEPAREVIILLEPLRDAWRQIAMNGVAEGGAVRTEAEAASSAATHAEIPTSRTIISA